MSQSNPTEIQVNTYTENYVLYGDQSRAWRVTFPDSKCKPETVHYKASLLHKLEKVQKRIVEVRSMLTKQTEEEFSITVSDLKKMLVLAARGGLKGKIDAQKNNVPVNIAGAVAAISEINRMDGNHAVVKTEHSGAINLTNLTDEELEARKKQAEQALKQSTQDQ